MLPAPTDVHMSSLLESQQSLEHRLRQASSSTHNDEQRLKAELMAALDSSRKYNQELRESLQIANQALTIETTRRAEVEKDLAAAVEAMNKMKRPENAEMTIDEALLRDIRKREDEIEEVRARLEHKINTAFPVQHSDEVSNIRDEIQRLQEARAIELKQQLDQLEEQYDAQSRAMIALEEELQGVKDAKTLLLDQIETMKAENVRILKAIVAVV
jgi:chromosome segregation ATPase